MPMLEKGLASLSGWTTRFYARAQVTKEIGWRKVKEKLMNERGGVSLEWLALGVLVVALVGALATFFQDNKGGGIGSAITNFFTQMINNLTSDGK